MSCYFDLISSTTTSGHHHTNGSTLSQIFSALSLPDCQPSTGYQPNCHKPTSPPTNSPPCNPAIAFIISQYRMTETCHAFMGMCQNRQALIFCQLSHRSTVPTMEGYYHVTMLSVPTVLTCRRFDSVIIPQYFCSIPSQGRSPTVPRNTAPRNTAPTRKRFRH